MTSDTENISIGAAQDLLTQAFEACGASHVQARATAIALVAAEAEGQIGHGFSRIDDYAAQLKSGKVNGTAEPRITDRKPSSILIDAENGFAFPALDLGIEEGAKAAKQSGCASIGIWRSHHCGALSMQVEKLAQRGLIGIMVANSPASIAPWGATMPMFGTNPIAFAAPRKGASPLVIDLSVSKVARGKVMHARKTGQSIPDDWALDIHGNPTTVPEEALAGSMVPIGQAKGYALALMVEVLSSSLIGASPSEHMSSFFESEGEPPNAGQFLLAIAPPDPSAFEHRITPLLERIETMDGARLPGKRRATQIAHSVEHGINVPSQYLETARNLAAS